MGYEDIEIRRDCEAIQIPQGAVVLLPKGTRAVVTQALGDTYTLQVPSMGGLFRVADRDADALGKTPKNAPTASSRVEGPIGAEVVWAELKNVFDPEIPVNIVDLGLIYDLQVQPLSNGGSKVAVKMTLTAQGCGMGPAIAMDAQRRIEQLPGVAEAEVQVVWDPPWSPQMISPEGREKLGMS